MTTQATIYKNVILKDFRTNKVIDTIIENVNNGMSTTEIAKIIGIDNYRPLVGIIRKLNQGGHIKIKAKKEVKRIKEAKLIRTKGRRKRFS